MTGQLQEAAAVTSAAVGSDLLDPAACRLSLDRSTPVPLWFQVEEYLAEGNQRIDRGELIGTERELAERFLVSRSTIRQTVSMLRKRGIVIAQTSGVSRRVTYLQTAPVPAGAATGKEHRPR